MVLPSFWPEHLGWAKDAAARRRIEELEALAAGRLKEVSDSVSEPSVNRA
jgi:hypothetical protein